MRAGCALRRRLPQVPVCRLPTGSLPPPAEDRLDIMHDRTAAFAARSPLWTAMLLSLGAAISNGLSRFSVGLLLPMMRADLGWSYLMAGAMNTSNAVGYLLGALTTPALLRRLAPWPVLVIGA